MPWKGGDRVSVEAIQHVIDDKRIKGASKLLAIVLAHHAHKDGSNAYPKVKTLAHETGMSVPTVKRELRKLAEVGIIRRDGRAPGAFPQYAPIRWAIVMADGSPATPLEGSPVTPLEGSPVSGRGFTREPLEGSPANPRTVREQSENSERERAAHSLPSDFELTEDRREVAIANGIPHDKADRVFSKFADDRRAKGTQRVDWDAEWSLWCQRERPDPSDVLDRAPERAPVPNLARSFAICRHCDDFIEDETGAVQGMHQPCYAASLADVPS